MAMNFWEAQRRAKSSTTLYLCLFFFLTFAAAFVAEWILRTLFPQNYNPPIPYVGLALLGIIFLTAGVNYWRYLRLGGAYVAQSLGARKVDPASVDPKERQLLNIMQEMALATSLPQPPTYILEAKEINAFAAGTSPENAAITVTRGTLEKLNRDELQGVLAHEFGHVYNGDSKIGLRLAAMLMGFFIASYMGLRLLAVTSYQGGGGSRKKGASPILLAALVFLVVGALLWFFGSILQAMVSRQREYLADASAVQFTRNPYGIANALRKIGASTLSDMPKSGKAFSHLYLNDHPSFWARLFATHPPLSKRIAALEEHEYVRKKTEKD